MLVAAYKPGHDGSVAIVDDGRLIRSIEAEKNSFDRHAPLGPVTTLEIEQTVDRVPDVIALGGWKSGQRALGAGYHGVDEPIRRRTNYFGSEVEFFSSSHVRSHIMMAVGMAPRLDPPQQQAVLVWEGVTGGFYLVDSDFSVERSVPVLTQPGARYAFLFALADPTFPDAGAVPDLSDSGKLMALAAYGDSGRPQAGIDRTVDAILDLPTIYPAPKGSLRDSPVYNAGVQAQVTKDAAALLSNRMFEVFASAAKEHLPAGVPLRISGGCGLNCEWNARWSREGYFSSVFVPPCTNDSGSAIGTAIDAIQTGGGDPYISWDVYSGERFDTDCTPDPQRWVEQELDVAALSDALAAERVAGWVQDRWEIGPRALGNRSILAEPFHPSTRDRLNELKQRESYRPIAPACRVEDLRAVFDDDFPDPYMLYFRRFAAGEYGAVTHVDGTARVQTVSEDSNRKLHELLSAFAARHGTGILCNTSLNFKGRGFINRMSDLVEFAESHGLDDLVVGSRWFTRR